MITIQENENLMDGFMEKVNQYFHKNTDFNVLGYHEAPTDSEKVIRLSVFLAEKDYNYDDGYKWARELGAYMDTHFSELPALQSCSVHACPHFRQTPSHDFSES